MAARGAPLGLQRSQQKTLKSLNRNQITLYGTQVFLEWVKTVKPELHRWTLATLNHRPSAYLIAIEDQNCHGDALKLHLRAIIEEELSRFLYIPRDLWPVEITFDLFEAWFTYQYHEDICDLVAEQGAVHQD